MNFNFNFKFSQKFRCTRRQNVFGIHIGNELVFGTFWSISIIYFIWFFSAEIAPHNSICFIAPTGSGYGYGHGTLATQLSPKKSESPLGIGPIFAQHFNEGPSPSAFHPPTYQKNIKNPTWNYGCDAIESADKLCFNNSCYSGLVLVSRLRFLYFHFRDERIRNLLACCAVMAEIAFAKQ